MKKITSILLLSFAATISFGQTNVVPDDVEFLSLKAIYDSLDGPNWTTKTNWPTPGSWPSSATAAQMDAWHGITVTNGDISGITLESNKLKGKLPGALQSLTKLTSLYVRYNQLNGSLPACIGNMTALNFLYIGYNQFTGALSSSIGNLTNLTELDITNNPFTGSLPASLNSLTQLKRLFINANSFSGAIPDLGNLNKLVYLILSGNFTPGPIPSWLSQLTSLTDLTMSNCNRTGSIPTSLSSLTNLKTLYLTNNQLTGSIPPEIDDLVSLEYLILPGNQLTGSIPAEIGNLSNLLYLHLYGNQLTGTIPSGLAQLNSLRSLALYNNQLSGTLPGWIGNLTTLTDLQLQNNQFSGPIPATFGSLNNLTYLNLNFNKISGIIPTELGNLTNLRRLYLNNNLLTGEIPVSLSGLINIEYFYLSFNQLRGSVPSFSNFTKVILFSLESNNLSGAIPAMFGSWAQALAISIPGNGFSGAFPSVQGMNALTSLSISNNQFTSLPSNILNLPVLAVFHAAGNELPTCPNFATHSNKANLTLKLENNRLDFSQMELMIGTGIKTVTLNPQKNIADVVSVNLTEGSTLTLTARPTGTASTVTWEKLNGVTWTLLNNDQDAVPQTYTRNSGALTDEGTYRWKMTNTIVTGMTLTSDPIVVKTLQRFALDNWGFQYKYDARKRMIAKKVPGADWVYMVYDGRDRLVLTQDGELRKTNKWSFTKYDLLNRPILTGIRDTTVALSQVQMQAVVDAHFAKASAKWGETYIGTVAGNVHGYTNKAYPVRTGTASEIDPNKYLSVTYYDDYAFRNLWCGNYLYSNEGLSATVNSNTYTQPPTEFLRVVGNVTGIKTKVLDGGTTGGVTWLKSITYYDDKQRVIQTISDNFKGGTDQVTSIYDFSGKILKSKATYVERNVRWKDIVGASVDGNKLTQIVSGAWGTTGAASVEQLPASQNGWMEVIVSESAERMIGLSWANPNAQYNSISYAVYMSAAGLFRIYQSGTLITTIPGLLLPGDIIGIERNGTSIIFYKNGASVHTITTTSTPLLMVDGAISTLNGSLTGVRSSFSTKSHVITRTFDYDHAGRLLQTWHSVDDSTPILLAQNEYNELGQLVDKKLYSTDNGNNFKQSVDYRYNVRGWLTTINNSKLMVDNTNDETNDLFGMELGYNNSLTGLGNTAMFDGNISAMKWSVNQGLGIPAFGTPTERAYKFSYDLMSRLKSASHLDNIGIWAASSAYHEDNLQYDLNGNIKNLNRTGQGGSAMDILSYDYNTGSNSGNQLFKVSDAGDKTKGFIDGVNSDADYVYDANGNMIADKNKSVTSIAYNYMNLPDKVTKSNGDYIKYIYDATGRKLNRGVYNSANALQKKSDYVGEYFYENDTLKFINHEEGRITMTATVPEYQYHMKDHLGNVRLTFTTKDEADESKATLETANASYEQNQFLNTDKGRKINSALFDHTYDSTTPPVEGTFALRLSGSANEKIGLAKSLSVMPGDKIDVEVFAKYVDAGASNDAALMSILAAIASGGTLPAGTIMDGAGYATAGSTSYPFAGLLNHNDNGTAPKAYLNYLVFDRNYVFKTGGFKRLTTEARESGDLANHTGLAYQGTAHQRIAFDGADQIVIMEPGYMYIWLSNENETPVEVYFDDFKVTHTKSPVIQSDDYYPFGLTFNSYQRENSAYNKWKFQGQEHVDDLGLNWDSFKWRNHQPDIGRFFNVDPIAEKYFYNSPYAFSENKVVAHIELEGLESVNFQLRVLPPVMSGKPSFGANQYRSFPSSYTATVNMADKSLITDCDGVSTPKGTDFQVNKDGSLNFKGVVDFGNYGLAAFSVTIKNNIEKDGSLNVQSAIVGDNTLPLEMVMSGTEDGEMHSHDATLINTVPVNRKEGFSFLNDMTPQEGKSNTDIHVIKGDGNDVFIDKVKDGADKNYQKIETFNKKKESTPAINKNP